MKKQKIKGKRKKLEVTAAFASLLLTFAFLLFSSSCAARGGVVPENAAFGSCPVCRMQVKASDDWTAEIYYNDHTKLMFESPGDMLAFYTAPEKYAVDEVHKSLSNIQKISVKDYQSKQPADARQAKFVFKSKVEGPMGPDFLPFAKKEDAEAFVAANGGTLFSLDEVTSSMVREVRK
jgi:copper chaperone NosL